MDISVEPGTYVIAVSGGVDSVALLHYLQQIDDLNLTVAHFDHGIRDDSDQDRRFVQKNANDYQLPFVFDVGNLGPAASEAKAREARYQFLQKVADAVAADAIITAHHQDDVVETAIINLMRGTGRKGLTALGTRSGIERPLTDVSKQSLIAYAKDQGLVWREDSTNSNQAYLRNYVRHHITNGFDLNTRQEFSSLINKQRRVNEELDKLLEEELQLNSRDGVVNRQWFIQLPHSVAKEILATWLRSNKVSTFDSKTLERLAVAAKVGQSGRNFDVISGVTLSVSSDGLALNRFER